MQNQVKLSKCLLQTPSIEYNLIKCEGEQNIQFIKNVNSRETHLVYGCIKDNTKILSYYRIIVNLIYSYQCTQTIQVHPLLNLVMFDNLDI